MLKKSLQIVVLTMTLSACSSLSSLNPFKSTPEPKLPGERISILQLQRNYTPDEDIANKELALSKAITNTSWEQTGGSLTHYLGNLTYSNNFEEAWSVNIGKASSKNFKITSQPIVANGKIYTLDAYGKLSAIDLASGNVLWQVRVASKEKQSEVFGGGIAYSNNKLFVTVGYNEVLALSANNGGLIWLYKTESPIRATPTASEDKVFVQTVNNQTIALDNTGKLLWKHSGLSETAGILGSAGPTVDKDIVVVAYTSGELYALRAENGRVLWTDNLSTLKNIGALSKLSNIRGLPVIENGLLIAISHAQKLVAIDMRSGMRVWQKEIGGVETPIISGDFIYVINNNNDIIALEKLTGKIKWINPLNTTEEDKETIWTGPILSNNQLIMGSSTGKIITLDALTGAVIKTVEASDNISVAPIIVDNTLLVLTDDAILTAYK